MENLTREMHVTHSTQSTHEKEIPPLNGYLTEYYDTQKAMIWLNVLENGICIYNLLTLYKFIYEKLHCPLQMSEHLLHCFP